MDGCRYIQEILFHSNGNIGAESRTAIEEHLSACPECAREYGHLRELRTLLEGYRRPELSPEEWDRWDCRLERALDAVDAETVPRFAPFRSGSVMGKHHLPLITAAAAAVLLLGIAGERFLAPAFRTADHRVTAPAAETASVTVQEEARRYLDRSKLVFLGITHAEPTMPDQASPDIVRLKRMAGELLREAPDLKKKLAVSRSYRLYTLLDEMEVPLLQIANFDEKNGMAELEMVQKGVERKGLLFKINLEDLAIEANGAKPSPGPFTTESTPNL